MLFCKNILPALLLFYANACMSQTDEASKRDWWNVLHYDLSITPDYPNKFLSGSNIIEFEVVENGTVMQIDLYEPMAITSIVWQSASLVFERKGNAYTVHFPATLKKGQTETIAIKFEGFPQVAKKPPYESGWIWTTDQKGRPWMSVTCEGTGAAVWFPCKNVQDDEPDHGVLLSVTVPDSLVAIGNGRLQNKTSLKNGNTVWRWVVVNTINNYNIIPYIGSYVTWHEDYAGEKGKLDCDYWVLDYNIDKAKKQFKQVDTMLHCFEYWMGPYPFYEDSYKLVEAPHAGMEHQSAVAYGNNFGNGFRGKDLSGSGWGLKWDFIMVHESGHEWFGNSITAKGNGESWIHEGFTKYLETIYTSCLYGVEAGNDYSIGIRKKILNDQPMIDGSTADNYNKGSNLLHMIRQLTGDDVFRQLLRGLNKKFYHRNASSPQIEQFISTFTGLDLSKTFDQYLRTVQVPVLEYTLSNGQFEYRWTNCVKGFNMPVKISFTHKKNILLHPVDQWQKEKISANEKTITVDRNFYVGTKIKSTTNQ